VSIEIAVFHNGASDLPVKTNADGVSLTDGSMAEVAESLQRSTVNQVRQAVLADQLGFDMFLLTEHHFQPEGAEFSPNPLLSQAAIASLTKRIRLGQAANIITWHHPLRFAEQVAMLDVLSGGRVDVGMGRGYQPRENETLGRTYGSTIQDQERNRTSFQEAYDIIIKAWTEASFSHRGENFSIPPTYTKWHHKQTIAYFQEEGRERMLEDVLAIGAPDAYSSGPPATAATTTLKEISVFPKPLQQPYPQVWQPSTSPRSIEWSATHGCNVYSLADVASKVKNNLRVYKEASEAAGWPDRLDRGPLKYGWDGDKRRGLIAGRGVHICQKGIGDMKRAGRALELQWDYYTPFGFAAGLAEYGEKPYPFDTKVTADLLREKKIHLHGTAEYVTEQLLELKDYCGYEDFATLVWFELNGFAGEEVEEQMHCFAEEVMPVLRRECGGGPDFPDAGLDFTPGPRAGS
jgi:alkanesulfonate monooxygenase SsuD/methylene tetrahydromethanopterin reductase-like flavin-dependent oxidoreductase (luciferase family)